MGMSIVKKNAVPFIVFIVTTASFIGAGLSPLLAWRDPIYIIAGFAGILALALLSLQPLVIGGYISTLNPIQNRHLHRWIGGVLVCTVLIHVVALWVTSPPDVIDALLFASPTSFSIWGVIAMWAVFGSACLAIFRRRIQQHIWRLLHGILVFFMTLGSVVHALLIEGTMESVSKITLCILVLLIALKVLSQLPRN
jgi:hypothetical protein